MMMSSDMDSPAIVFFLIILIDDRLVEQIGLNQVVNGKLIYLVSNTTHPHPHPPPHPLKRGGGVHKVVWSSSKLIQN